MENTFIISDYSDKMKRIISLLSIYETNVIPNEIFNTEKGYHDWITGIFKKHKIEKLIIPLSLPTDSPIINTDALILALHLRLNYELPLPNRLIPIVFLSNFTIETIIAKTNFDTDNNPQNLLFTKGIYFTSFDPDDIVETLNDVQHCPENEYQNKLLPQLNIRRKATTGGHDIGNAWGCFKLAQLIGFEKNIMKLENVSNQLKQLYVKSLICKNESFTNEKRIELDYIDCKGKNILFIDDKANEGWEILIKQIFKNAGDGLVSVDSSNYKADDNHGSFKNFEGFYAECQSHIGKKWDLIIIDLRLNPDIEDIDNSTIKPNEFSGYKLIDEFLTSNEGYQIVVSTASNKIWNINEVLKRGAVAYYIKESPEFNYSLKESKEQYENFKVNVKKSFAKSSLQELYSNLLAAKNTKTNINKDFLELSSTALDMAWELIKNEQLDFGFITLFQAVENYADSCYLIGKEHDKIDQTSVIDKTNKFKNEWSLTHIKDIKNGSFFCVKPEIQDKTLFPQALFKVSVLFKFKYQKDDKFLQNKIGLLNKIRNKIAHQGSKSFATINNVIEILEILKELRES